MCTCMFASWASCSCARAIARRAAFAPWVPVPTESRLAQSRCPQLATVVRRSASNSRAEKGNVRVPAYRSPRAARCLFQGAWSIVVLERRTFGISSRSARTENQNSALGVVVCATTHGRESVKSDSWSKAMWPAHRPAARPQSGAARRRSRCSATRFWTGPAAG